MTANAMEGERNKCIDAGMDDYISKPVKKSELAVMLNRWLPTKPSNGNGKNGGISPDIPAIDHAALDRLLDMDKDGPQALNELIDLYLQHTPGRIADLREAIARNDFIEARRIAHEVRGSSSNFGAARIIELCQIIESKAQTNDPAGAALADIADTIAMEFDAVRVFLRAIRARFNT